MRAVRADSPRWVEVSQSEFAHEREGLAQVRDLLPDRGPFRAWTNFEFRDRQGRWHEVDALVLGERRLHLVELKHYRGRITGNSYRWQRNGRTEDSPLPLTRRKAQRLKSVIIDELKELAPDLSHRDVPFVQECIYLHAADGSCGLAHADAADLFGPDGNERRSGLPSIAFLQRLGRTGRRAGSSRNALLLATTPGALLHGAGLLHLWSQGFVEPVEPPPDPAHVMAQQLMALCLQEGQVGEATWPEWWGRATPPGMQDASIADWLVETGHLERDGGMLFVGPEAEKRYGRRHFMELLSVFTAAPEVAVWAGREHIGAVSPIALTRQVSGPRIVLLAGRAWRVTAVDWRRRRCFVEPADSGGRASWRSASVSLLGSDVCQAQREVLLGAEPDVQLSRRAVAGLAELRRSLRHTANPRGSTVVRDTGLKWWTWAGGKANLTLMARLPSVVESSARLDNYAIRLRPDLSKDEVESALHAAHADSTLPEVSDDALTGLKFSEMLRADQARATLAGRLLDEEGARIAMQPRTYTVSE